MLNLSYNMRILSRCDLDEKGFIIEIITRRKIKNLSDDFETFDDLEKQDILNRYFHSFFVLVVMSLYINVIAGLFAFWENAVVSCFGGIIAKLVSLCSFLISVYYPEIAFQSNFD